MTSSILVSPPHSLVLVSGGAGVVPEQFAQGEAVAATPTMIAVGTLNEFDGQTRITLATDRNGVGDLKQAFVGHLHGLTGKIVVETIEGEVLLSGEAEEASVTVEVFSNDPVEPDDILIVYA